MNDDDSQDKEAGDRGASPPAEAITDTSSTGTSGEGKERRLEHQADTLQDDVRVKSDGGEDKEKTTEEKQEERKIKRQIRRAIGLLNSLEVGNMELRSQVLQELEAGKVPPIFHALVGNADLFPDGKLSASKATAGPEEVGGSETAILRLVASDYDVFFTKDGRGKSNVRENITSDMNWEFDVQATQTAVDLVNASAEMAGEGVEATQLRGTFGMEGSPNLITRSLSRGVVAELFQL